MTGVENWTSLLPPSAFLHHGIRWVRKFKLNQYMCYHSLILRGKSINNQEDHYIYAVYDKWILDVNIQPLWYIK